MATDHILIRGLATPARWARLREAGTAVLAGVAAASLVVGIGLGILFDASPRHLALNFSNPRTSDFALYYRDARVGIEFGWRRMYDPTDFATETRRVGVLSGDSPEFPSLSVPLLTWIVAPIALLPLDGAYAIWVGVVIASLAISFLLLSPFSGRARMVHGVLFALFGPVGLTVGLGQSVALVLLAIAAGTWLLRSGTEWAAGVALGLTLVKPQLVVLLPVCLLSARRWRAVAGWAGVGIAVLAAWVVVIGPADFMHYLSRVGSAAQSPTTWGVDRDVTPLVLIQGTPMRVAFVGVVAVAAAFVSARSADLTTVLAAGIVSSLLVTPYLHFQDLVLLFAAGSLLLSVRSSATARSLAGITYGQAALGISTVPLLEVAWLAYAAVRALRAEQPQAQIAASRSA